AGARDLRRDSGKRSTAVGRAGLFSRGARLPESPADHAPDARSRRAARVRADEICGLGDLGNGKTTLWRQPSSSDSNWLPCNFANSANWIGTLRFWALVVCACLPWTEIPTAQISMKRKRCA